MAENKTKPTKESVLDFINSVKEEQKRKDSLTILDMMKKATKAEPVMWGSSLIGFGNLRYKSPNTGKEGDWFILGFSPRKANLSLYLGMDVHAHDAALKKLGKHKTGVGCLYINKLEDVDLKVLKGMMEFAAKSKK